MAQTYPVLTFVLLLASVLAINQTCSFLESCPQNAHCNPLNNFCVCESGFIGSCLTPAEPIGQYPQILELTPRDFRLLYMVPLEVEEFLSFSIRVCRPSFSQEEEAEGGEDRWAVLYMWYEEGPNGEYSIDSSDMLPANLSFAEQCHAIDNKYIMFERQPNGESEMLIIGVANGPAALTLTLTAEQQVLLGVRFYYYIMIGILVFVGFMAATSAFTIILRRRGSIFSAAYAGQSNIDHFQIYMPSVPVQELSQGQECSICLQEFRLKEEVRKTPCEHVFHTGCIDCWCRQNVSCPVCRSDLTEEKIAEVRKQIASARKEKEMREVRGKRGRRRDGYQEEWEESQGRQEIGYTRQEQTLEEQLEHQHQNQDEDQQQRQLRTPIL